MSDDPMAHTLESIDRRLRTLEDNSGPNERRIRNIEQWQLTFDALNQERRKQAEIEFSRVNTRLDKIDGHLSRLMWIVIGALVTGVIMFFVNGGAAIAGS